MFQVNFSQRGMRLRELVTNSLSEAHAWIDARFTQFVWGGASIRFNGAIISTRSRSNPDDL